MKSRRRGQALIYVGILLLAFLSFAALVVDGARLYFSARETQAAADTAAIGGMLRLIETGNPSDAVAGAQEAGNYPAAGYPATTLNAVDGRPTSIDASKIFVGHWSCSPAGSCTPTFAPGLPPYNAVRTTPSYPISNLLGIWQSVSHPRRNATAAWLTLGTGIPGIPLVLANCFSCYSNACNPPPEEITFSAGGTGNSNSAWFYPTCTSGCGASAVGNYVPAGCGGGGLVAPTLNLGSTVNVGNGGITSVCRHFECLIGNQYLVGVVGQACGQAYMGTDTITGFATVRVLGTRCGANSPLGDAPVQANAIKAQVQYIDCTKPQNAPICSSQITSVCPGSGTGQVVMVE